ncbi:DNA polymerase IV [Mycoplasma iguanae]|uniref:DNA polymerase IV n=1 Tax=Mycoplasma iguanae TaxID=292461 RepID=A0ABY5RAU9_9MOLU|nr:DNA polymerase IV [Mycoplasma iguanae]UVD81877.1 DNA polymerase IV [Mycoplasma iguanae]
MPKVIFHIDIDSFFVSAHRIINPQLKNKPVIVAKQKTGIHGIATSVSYEARKLGIKIATPLSLIRKNFKNVYFVTLWYELYSYFSNNFFHHLTKTWTKKIEKMSIDECYLDATDLLIQKNISQQQLAQQIQKDIWDNLNLPVTIGIGKNKFLAKMATNRGKPAGIFHLDEKNFKSVIYPLPIQEFLYIGKSSIPKLNKMGIYTIGDFAKQSLNNKKLQTLFGIRFKKLLDNAHGMGDDLINSKSFEFQQIGKEKTFDNGFTTDHSFIKNEIKKICEQISQKAKSQNTFGQVISINFKINFHESFNKQKKLNEKVNNFKQIFQVASDIFEKYWNNQELRGIGVYLSELEKGTEKFKQVDLFSTETNSKVDSRVLNVVEQVNLKLEKKAVFLLNLNHYKKN